MNSVKILFIGDIFGVKGRDKVVELLPSLTKKHNIDFVIAQGENITNRKGLGTNDYHTLIKAGINVFTMGNHVWANPQINKLIKNDAKIIRPLNTHDQIGVGSKVFQLPNKETIRVTSLMGITFNKLFKPWNAEYADNFFDAIDEVIKNNEATYHFIDFHAETTSEKNVLGLYLDGKVNALVGTHTHVQTNDDRTLPKGTAFISDVGMTGPHNCAIGAKYKNVYKRMRYDTKTRFYESHKPAQFNAVVITMTSDKNFIEKIYIAPNIL